ncbi:Uncharacterized membrane protein [Pseudorhodobacter antarcticus]|uniref:Uncharacterized membrane protein n=1 Tax=Pseudorhodobacter antarcticus TaxID=1077947 RepID=A0A1H8G1L4_9RHOB|nr:DUF2177 family protein [Pseudorhodobacter antarcticus]SEN37832.1 Uncharacterized membrane protein [Pseudorhodobacter antarcticus]
MTLTAIAIFIAATGVFFLIADALMLGFVMGPMFRTHLGTGLLDGLRAGPAIAFYVLYMGGLTYFAGIPALRDGAATTALVQGAVLGLIAYGTYELTSWTVMRDWHPQMVIMDMAWGTVLSGVSAYIGARVALAFTS